jgi:hypothetical protein
VRTFGVGTVRTNTQRTSTRSEAYVLVFRFLMF